MILALTLALASLAQAPLPTKLVQAKTACIINVGTEQKWVDALADEFNKLKLFELVGDEEAADVVIALGEKSDGAVAVPMGNAWMAAETGSFVMSIVDRESKRSLWSDSDFVMWSNKRSLGNLARRLDKRLGAARAREGR